MDAKKGDTEHPSEKKKSEKLIFENDTLFFLFALR